MRSRSNPPTPPRFSATIDLSTPANPGPGPTSGTGAASGTGTASRSRAAAAALSNGTFDVMRVRGGIATPGEFSRSGGGGGAAATPSDFIRSLMRDEHNPRDGSAATPALPSGTSPEDPARMSVDAVH
jgi:hypothetical protein